MPQESREQKWDHERRGSLEAREDYNKACDYDQCPSHSSLYTQPIWTSNAKRPTNQHVSYGSWLCGNPCSAIAGVFVVIDPAGKSSIGWISAQNRF